MSSVNTLYASIFPGADKLKPGGIVNAAVEITFGVYLHVIIL